ncbi:molybdopterin-guanine dinucleotide biosynthesis protein B [Paenibacillus apiarius]|uniref:Molybdopterin-guanine dinucleotide biosynthesis protein B n=1 Tax=Paenibacillus apiarius TaxID=46240 RepID=A0ABT4DT25_9BACL|nr:molybdopterin-guanine dinucleotide biosynthesis protein B [Paenibacillus apiarius]MCY9513788.1 molybdopterin-guanine dinucleotide biosynthesis protein B [Paenibacillus apiarius]MCY9520512.1 molybdopterin-guanine dinucleotide biosynthesis protein B [Paenibacillus apiarius]MCY9550645.1 molybdopterin-guanine dinucleotide biosynthesis protein B [Paenibacillus apiarius]MCY9559166.1 molybdopterin-guanine dinucleotide biosynthesis protein B [Paenibacillus apiarius]MCY9683039.1 molybdopterin-guanin
MKILQVVGYKNCGKTTRIEKWIQFLLARGLCVSVIKHHGHGGPLSMPSADTDSMKFLSQGAVSSIAVGDGLVQMHMEGGPELPELIMLAALAKPDIIFVEGFKEALEPKVVIVRTKEEWDGLQKASNIVLVLAYKDANIERDEDITVLGNQDEACIDEWMLDYLEGER